MVPSRAMVLPRSILKVELDWVIMVRVALADDGIWSEVIPRSSLTVRMSGLAFSSNLIVAEPELVSFWAVTRLVTASAT